MAQTPENSGLDAELVRLGALFGEATLAPLLRKLRTQLSEAAALAPTDPVLVDRAHKAAGFAGTLGCAAASVAWLAVERGEPGALDRARSESAVAIAAIDRFVQRVK